MSIIKWNKKSYSVEVQELDDQHQVLFNQINDLYEALEGQDSDNTLDELIARLLSTLRIHFAVEESLMRILGYEGYAPHKVIHDQCMGHLRQLEERFRQGDREAATELLQYIHAWLEGHIREHDRAYSEHFLSQGPGGLLKRFW